MIGMLAGRSQILEMTAGYTIGRFSKAVGIKGMHLHPDVTLPFVALFITNEHLFLRARGPEPNGIWSREKTVFGLSHALPGEAQWEIEPMKGANPLDEAMYIAVTFHRVARPAPVTRKYPGNIETDSDDDSQYDEYSDHRPSSRNHPSMPIEVTSGESSGEKSASSDSPTYSTPEKSDVERPAAERPAAVEKPAEPAEDVPKPASPGRGHVEIVGGVAGDPAGQ